MHRDLVQDWPMAMPSDRVYYLEPIYSGKTAEQLFQEKLVKGEARFLGAVLRVDEEWEATSMHVLGDPGVKQRLAYVDINLWELYRDRSMLYYRNARRLKRFTPEEWLEE